MPHLLYTILRDNVLPVICSNQFPLCICWCRFFRSLVSRFQKKKLNVPQWRGNWRRKKRHGYWVIDFSCTAYAFRLFYCQQFHFYFLCFIIIALLHSKHIPRQSRIVFLLKKVSVVFARWYYSWTNFFAPYSSGLIFLLFHVWLILVGNYSCSCFTDNFWLSHF